MQSTRTDSSNRPRRVAGHGQRSMFDKWVWDNLARFGTQFTNTPLIGVASGESQPSNTGKFDPYVAAAFAYLAANLVHAFGGSNNVRFTHVEWRSDAQPHRVSLLVEGGLRSLVVPDDIMYPVFGGMEYAQQPVKFHGMKARSPEVTYAASIALAVKTVFDSAVSKGVMSPTDSQELFGEMTPVMDAQFYPKWLYDSLKNRFPSDKRQEICMFAGITQAPRPELPVKNAIATYISKLNDIGAVMMVDPEEGYRNGLYVQDKPGQASIYTFNPVIGQLVARVTYNKNDMAVVSYERAQALDTLSVGRRCLLDFTSQLELVGQQFVDVSAADIYQGGSLPIAEWRTIMMNNAMAGLAGL